MRRFLKKVMSLIIVFTLVIGCSFSNISYAATKKSKTNDKEIKKAISLKIVPKKLQSNYKKQITFAEYASILDATVKKVNSGKFAEWKKSSKAFRTKKAKMKRADGSVALFLAAMATDADGIGYDDSLILTDESIYWNDYSPNQKYYRNIDNKYFNKVFVGTDWEFLNNESIQTNSNFFTRRYSYGNGKCYLDYDENYNFKWTKALTRADAIKSAERLYETAICANFKSADKVNCGVTKKSITSAKSMPEATYNKLPDWKGYNISNANDIVYGDLGKVVSEEQIKMIANQGMDFVRVVLYVQDVYKQVDGKEYVSTGYVKNMDDMINYCAKYGIHVCFDVHRCPGFTTGDEDRFKITLFDNENDQKQFCDFWQWMAKHYKDVPSNLLSFNLLNEPHLNGDNLDENAYVNLMLKAIDSIRSVTPDRLIVCDVMSNGEYKPVYGLKDAKVVQSIHPYLLTANDTEWPAYFTRRLINKDRNDNLSIQGNFPAGTKVTVSFSGVHLESDMTLRADGNDVDKLHIGAEKVGENNCLDIREAGTGGECRMYDNRIWTVTLNADAKKLDLLQVGEGYWYMYSYIRIEAPTFAITISGNQEEGKTPHIIIDDKGKAKGAGADMLYCTDKTYINERFKDIVDFSKQYGEAIMAQEIGCDPAIPNQVVLDYNNALLLAFKDLNIPWAFWCNSFGIWIGKNQEKMAAINKVPSWQLRPGVEYKDLGNGWYEYTALAELLKNGPTEDSSTPEDNTTEVTPTESILDKYTSPDKLAQPRLSTIAAFDKTVVEEKAEDWVLETVSAVKANVEFKALNIDGIHIYDLNVADGKKKPLLILLHGGGGSRKDMYKGPGPGDFLPAHEAMSGFRVVTVDAAGCGDSQVGPIDALASFAETVGYIDTIIEYYNTLDDVDAYSFALKGCSMGGNTAFAYVAHGKYRPKMIVTEAGIPGFYDLADGPLYDCFDHGKSGQPTVMSKEDIQEFARRYSPINWPEKFKDVYVVAGNYLGDPVEPSATVKELEQILNNLGYTNHTFVYEEGDIHGRPPKLDEYDGKLLHEIMLGN